MTSLGTYSKHSQAVRAYPTILYNLGTNVVSNLSGASTPAGLTVSSVTFDIPTNQVIAVIGGGVNGVSYIVAIQFDLSNGEHPVYTFIIEVRDD